MSVCEVCGDKRCPHAADHRQACQVGKAATSGRSDPAEAPPKPGCAASGGSPAPSDEPSEREPLWKLYLREQVDQQMAGVYAALGVASPKGAAGEPVQPVQPLKTVQPDQAAPPGEGLGAADPLQQALRLLEHAQAVVRDALAALQELERQRKAR
jgi:hypothetical protein